MFSLFGKKEGAQRSASKRSAARSKREGKQPAQAAPAAPGMPSGKRDPQKARATVQKIDAIESEMSSEFIPTTMLRASTTIIAPTTLIAPPDSGKLATAPGTAQTDQKSASAVSSSHVPQKLDANAGGMSNTTAMLCANTLSGPNVAGADAAPVMEEAAILFSGGQTDMVEHMLHAAISSEDGSEESSELWLMLLDLYQLTNRPQEFEQLSMEFASRFETSPPTWHNDIGNTERGDAGNATKDTKPIAPFSGKLDASASKYIDRVQNLAANYRTIRLEFIRVNEVAPDGCQLLLNALNKLQKSGHELVLVGAPELIGKIRSIIEVGRRDDTEPCWLLMLELMRLLNCEKDFEEASIDYCVTFEVSPPAFVAPQGKVTTACGEAQPSEEQPGMLMPPIIEGRIDELIYKIASYSAHHNPATLDCRQLVRVDFNAAGRLLSGLAPFCGNGRMIEFHNVNQLVISLFNVIGLQNLVRIYPRKN